MPATVASRNTATRFVPGEISLSSSSHLAPMLYSNLHEASGIATRPREAGDYARSDRIDGGSEYDGDGAARLLQCSHNRNRRSQNDVWRERQQLRRVFTHAVGIEESRAPAIVDPHVSADDRTQLL